MLLLLLIASVQLRKTSRFLIDSDCQTQFACHHLPFCTKLLSAAMTNLLLTKKNLPPEALSGVTIGLLVKVILTFSGREFTSSTEKKKRPGEKSRTLSIF